MKNEYIIEGDICKIRLTEDVWTTIDTIDLPKVSAIKKHWRLNKATGYVEGCFKNKHVYLHRFLNDTPDGLLTDHIDRNKLDNRRCALRTVTWSESLHNRNRFRNNTTGYTGVFRVGNRYRATIKVDYKQIYLGQYATAEEAARAYDAGKMKHRPSTPTTCLNFPSDYGTQPG